MIIVNDRRTVNVSGVPAPLAFKSMATVHNGVVYVSGQIGKGPDGQPLDGVEAQAVQAFEQLKAILEAAGSDLDNILRMATYVVNVDDLLVVSDVKRRYIKADPPASFGFAVAAIALGALVEIEAVAAVR